MQHDVDVDALIVGAGPVGLYAAYYAGFRGRSVALMDSLPEIGGQVCAMYPEKLIYDIAGFPAVRGRDLIASLAEQAGRYGPRYLLGEEAQSVEYDHGTPIVTAASVAICPPRKASETITAPSCSTKRPDSIEAST